MKVYNFLLGSIIVSICISIITGLLLTFNVFEDKFVPLNIVVLTAIYPLFMVVALLDLEVTLISKGKFYPYKEKNKCSKYDEIVKKILNNPLDYEWELQGFGMLRTYIDKDTRMQIWLNSFIIQDVTDIHTHPWDFTSCIYQGRVSNFIFKEDSGYFNTAETFYDKCYILTGENAYVKSKEKVNLIRTKICTYLKGETYVHSKVVPHRINFKDGTITILTKMNKEEHNSAYSYVRAGGEWVSAAPKPATKKEILTFIDAAKRLQRED